ncbi:MAG TPA: glycosyltransferase [Terracidiphilus sp.]|jgi:glycosyltransferase involved in cell wall biosynthesis
MSRLRILVLAPDTNPESITGPLLSFRQSEELAKLHDVTLVVRSTVEEAVRRAQVPFCGVEVVRMPTVERVYDWSFRRIFKGDYRSQALTAFGYPFALAFEWYAWRQLKGRVIAGEFDVVLRLLPIVSVMPSPFAFFLRHRPVPFVIGPLNGGLPWPQGFRQADNQKEWVSGLRSLYRFLPFARATYRNAAAIVAGSSQTYAEFARHREKLFFLPENGVSRSLCYETTRGPERNGRLELIFAGSLVPYKACDLALRAAAPLLRSGLAYFTVLGDGPERDRLELLAKSLQIEKSVAFCGPLSHTQALARMQSADVLLFPSVREFGGAVVFEALASGAVPIVADFGGPGDIVNPEVGYKVPLTNEEDMVSRMGEILAELAKDRELLEQLRRRGIAYARESLTWDGKAQTLTAILRWALRQGPKPNLPPPKVLYSSYL